MKNSDARRGRSAAAAAASILLILALAPYAPARQAGAAKGGAGSQKSLPAKSKRFALVVGVDKYADTQITTLGGASNDARSLASALVKYAGFPADQVVLLATDQPEERQPTRGNILRRLSNLATVVPKDGLLLFAFAGHGMERGGQAFLLPSDAQVSDDVTLLEQTAVNVLQIRDWVKRTGVKQVLMILDACRNDPSGRVNADNPLTETYTRGFNFDTRNREVEAFVTLYATAIGHRAYEYKEKRQGYFTWALVEALRGAAANDRGEVTLDGLVKYLQERVPKQVQIDLGAGKAQKPFAVIEGYKADELVLSVAEAGGRGLSAAPKDD
ncbi:MAG TPA: caspase family protein, partial [Pyrinomonadaceae bacterium]|nr:caspase family protein [Pyrinomonadaceae bacterium]